MKQVNAALKDIGIPVYAGVWRATSPNQNPPVQYCVYSTTTTEASHHDDHVTSLRTYVYLNLWSDIDPTDMADTMDSMRKKLETIQEEVRKSMEQYDPMEEFGVDVVTYREMIDSVNSFFEDQINRGGDSDIEFSEYDESDDTKEEPVYVKLLENPDNDIVYERHGWKFVKDFFSDIPVLEDGRDYDMLFQIIPGKANNTAFANIALGLLLRSYPRDPEKKRSLGCSVSDSKDGINHFWLLKRKA